MPANPQKQYVIGRGKTYFDQFLAGTQTKTGERYLGNTPALSMTSAYTNLDHYDADEGLRVKDDSAQLQLDRNGTFQCDNINMPNAAIMFGSTAAVETEAGSTGESSEVVAYTGRYYQLGVTDAVADGVGNVTNVVVTNSSGIHAVGYVTFVGQPLNNDTFTLNGEVITFKTTPTLTHDVQIGTTLTATAQNFAAHVNAYPSLYDVAATGVAAIITLRAIAAGTAGNSIGMVVSGTDPDVSGATLAGGSAGGVIALTTNYTVDADRGRIYILEDAVDVTDGDTLQIAYDISAGSRQLVVDAQDQVEGALRFIADNARGPNKDYYWPRVKLTPSGEYQLKGDAWQVMTFNFEVLQPAAADTKRVYVRSPVTA